MVGRDPEWDYEAQTQSDVCRSWEAFVQGVRGGHLRCSSEPLLLASSIPAIMNFGFRAGEVPLVKGPGFLITDFINMLQAEFSSEESHKSYCNGRQPTRRMEILKPSLQSTLPNCEQPPPDPQHPDSRCHWKW